MEPLKFKMFKSNFQNSVGSIALVENFIIIENFIDSFV